MVSGQNDLHPWQCGVWGGEVPLANAYRHINQGDAGAEVRIRLVGVDKGVLSPIADHQTQSHEREGPEEDKGRRLAVEAVQGVQEGVVAELPESRLEAVLRLTLAEKVPRQVEPDQKDEASDVVQEVEDVVTLVADGGRQVVGAVALDVVMFYVVVKVRVPGVAHEGVGDVGKRGVEEAQDGPVF